MPATTTAPELSLNAAPAGPAATSAAAYNESPFVLILRLSYTLHTRIPLVKQSSSLLLQWATEGLAWLRGKSAAVAAIDDEVVENRDLFERALANDDPATRRRALAILDRLTAKTTREAAALQAGRDVH